MLQLDAVLKKHAREFKQLLGNHKYEQTEDGGIYFPSAHAVARGMYVHDVNGLDVRYDPNLLPTEGLNHMLSVEFGTATKPSAWYLALYSGAVSPSATWTAANFTSNSTEITSTSEGYTEATRQAFTGSTPAGGSTTNSSSKAAYTIATATTLTVNGAGMLTVNTRGGTTGVLISATRFASARSLSNADIFNLGYTVALTSS